MRRLPAGGRANTAAIAADEKFLARGGAMNFYTLYRAHNYHFKIYGAMFLGQARAALDRPPTSCAAAIPEELLRVRESRRWRTGSRGSCR